MRIRQSWHELGVSKERYRELRAICEDRRHEVDVEVTAVETAPFMWLWLVESVTKNKTYEVIEFDKELGRIPCGRSDFYGYRRQFYRNLDEKIKRGEAYTINEEE